MIKKCLVKQNSGSTCRKNPNQLTSDCKQHCKDTSKTCRLCVNKNVQLTEVLILTIWCAVSPLSPNYEGNLTHVVYMIKLLKSESLLISSFHEHCHLWTRHQLVERLVVCNVKSVKLSRSRVRTAVL
jgi:hypothetical protein